MTHRYEASAGARMRVLRGEDAVAQAAAAAVVGELRTAIARRGRALLALTDGTTMLPVLRRLARRDWRGELDWARVEILFAAERCVPPSDPRSDYRLVKDTLLDPLRIPATRVHRIAGELPPSLTAQFYERELRHVLGDDPLDLALLGLGKDGHTAALFPGSRALHETDRCVVPCVAPDPPHRRITLTPPVLAAARRCLFVVTGASRAPAAARALGGDDDETPIGCLRDAGMVGTWWLDAAAAEVIHLGSSGHLRG